MHTVQPKRLVSMFSPDDPSSSLLGTRSPASTSLWGGESRVQTGLKHPFLEAPAGSFSEPQTALGSAQTPVCRMCPGSEDEVDLFLQNSSVTRPCPSQPFSWCHGGLTKHSQ